MQSVARTTRREPGTVGQTCHDPQRCPSATQERLPSLARTTMTRVTMWTGKGTCSQYVAKVLIEDFNADPALATVATIATLPTSSTRPYRSQLVCDALESHPSLEGQLAP